MKRLIILILLLTNTAYADGSVFSKPAYVAPLVHGQSPAVNLPYPNQIYAPPVIVQQPSTDYVDRAYRHETERAIIQNLDSDTRLNNQKYLDNFNKPAQGINPK